MPHQDPGQDSNLQVVFEPWSCEQPLQNFDLIGNVKLRWPFFFHILNNVRLILSK